MTENQKNQVQWLTITQRNAGQRLDNFLLATLKGVPKSHIYRIVRKGEVRVNKGRAKVHVKLQLNDLVRIPPIRTAEKMAIPKLHPEVKARLTASILFENKHFLILNKPAGMAVHGGSGVSLGVIEAIRQIRPEAKEWELAHRLDKDTSGCLMIAKRRSGLRMLQALQRENKIQKTYLALLNGCWKQKKQQVNAPLQKNQAQGGQRIVRIDSQGQNAKTLFFNEQSFPDATLVRARLVTGRTHQIRVHSASILKHAILGDYKYGDENANKIFKKKGLNRMFLHAYQLKFAWADTDEIISVNAPLDRNLHTLLNNLKK